ncbi:unnamed protein product [Didymodactylos carnosus]|uniref:Uncharacterized protein n=1 Tax=Didymodactylos carnosus TaxID=1234261 RepID=A0A815ZBG9_9BILA|nr:unnamed protein product [Didymodactylos carnosus]CAF1580607.1 unnamed protein product [Didymodactylos carnosus]CAF4232202.1 unnamed protein product [Didymodactylos carnosus]CAF4447798.1 unnamed protein product [Didymodactylos carnosus]
MQRNVQLNEFNEKARISQDIRNDVVISRKNRYPIAVAQHRSVTHQRSTMASSKTRSMFNSHRVYTEPNDVRSMTPSPLPVASQKETHRLSLVLPPSTAESTPRKNHRTDEDGWIPPTVQMLVLRPLNTVEIRTRCIFLRVGEIDTLNERFYAEILFEASWNDIQLQNETCYNSSLHWNPKLIILNSVGDIKHEISYSIENNKDETNIPEVTEHHRIRGMFWERMELYYFPADVQELSLSITTSRNDNELRFFQNQYKPSGVIRTIFTDEQEWYLYEHCEIHIQAEIEEFSDDGDRVKRAIVVCTCHVARKYGYFLWNLYFLIFLITSASFCTFAIPISNTQGRVQVSCTLLLTSVTFRWTANKSLPTISYLTAVDVYAIGSIFALCLLNIYHGIIGYINYYTSTNVSTTSSGTVAQFYLVVIDRYTLIVFTALYFIYQALIIYWMWNGPWKRRRLMCKKDSDKKRNYFRDGQQRQQIQREKHPPPLLTSKSVDIKTTTSTVVQDLE